MPATSGKSELRDDFAGTPFSPLQFSVMCASYKPPAITGGAVVVVSY